MKVLLKKASDWSFYKNIEINSLEELLKVYSRLVVESDKTTLDIYKSSINDIYDKNFEILVTIYDDYIE